MLILYLTGKLTGCIINMKSDTEINFDVKDRVKQRYIITLLFVITASFTDAVFFITEVFMKKRIAVISIIIEETDSIEGLNTILSSFREYIIGRMGLPYKERGVYIISIALDAPEDIINALSGKIGRLKGVNAKTNYSNIISEA